MTTPLAIYSCTSEGFKKLRNISTCSGPVHACLLVGSAWILHCCHCKIPQGSTTLYSVQCKAVKHCSHKLQCRLMLYSRVQCTDPDGWELQQQLPTVQRCYYAANCRKHNVQLKMYNVHCELQTSLCCNVRETALHCIQTYCMCSCI